MSSGGGGGGGGGTNTSMEASDSRFPQWSMQETKEFLMIRAELDQTFMETKRNKLLWEVISTKMREKGFNRSAEQCKCKWKNLVTRYKGCETMEPDAMRQQFPFYNEMQAIFTSRMERMLWSEAQGGAGGSGGLTRKKAMSSDEEDDNEESEGDQKTVMTTTSTGTNRKKKKAKVTNVVGSSGGTTNVMNNAELIREMLGEFMKQQMAMEMQWREREEAREEERRVREMEWRREMEALENERVNMERRWREGEERRRMREEARADNRDALITALLNKLRREDQSSSSSHHHHQQHLP
ncbi:unnamed protein product [Rhodiola kirilowii]